MSMLANGRLSAAAQHPSRPRRSASAFDRAVTLLAAARGLILWAVLALSTATVVAAVGLILWRQDINAKITELGAGKDVTVDVASAPPALLEARADFFLTRDRIAEAQPFLDQAALAAGPAERVRMLYNMANTRLRTAVGAIQQGQFDQATPQIALAKAEYRSALRLDPGNWDARYNLDVAMRLVRDLPRDAGEDADANVEEPAQLWTDLPGVPKGLP